MATAYLDNIVSRHRERATHDHRDWRERLTHQTSPRPSFRGALERTPGDALRVIGELKRRSPSKGWLAPDLDVIEMATCYERSGASAVSVLTDQEFFAGSLTDLSSVAAHVALPLLRKDFTVCENDVLDARDAGASAILLIVAALSDDELSRFHHLALQLGLDALVEVHDHTEAQRALDAGAALVGVNQRDLRSFEVDAHRAAQIVESVTRGGVVIVCESAISSLEDVQRAADAGYDAVLVGEAFVTSTDPARSVRAFSSVTPSP